MQLLPDLKCTSKAKHCVILFCEFLGMGSGYILIYPSVDRPKGSSPGWGQWIIEKLGTVDLEEFHRKTDYGGKVVYHSNIDY